LTARRVTNYGDGVERAGHFFPRETKIPDIPDRQLSRLSPLIAGKRKALVNERDGSSGAGHSGVNVSDRAAVPSRPRTALQKDADR